MNLLIWIRILVSWSDIDWDRFTASKQRGWVERNELNCYEIPELNTVQYWTWQWCFCGTNLPVSHFFYDISGFRRNILQLEVEFRCYVLKRNQKFGLGMWFMVRCFRRPCNEKLLGLMLARAHVLPNKKTRFFLLSAPTNIGIYMHKSEWRCESEVGQ